jgi:type IV pilus assembly protein PilC
MSEEKTSFFQKEITFGKPFSDKLKENFYKEFSNLLDSGVDIQRSLTILIDEQEKKQMISILEDLLNHLIGGNSLSEACKKTTHFSAYEYQSIRIGEETGRLKIVLDHLSQYYGDKVKLRRQLIGVFTYPAFVLCITIGVLYFMLTSVVPMFKDVFSQFGQELPMLTQKIIWLSNYFTTFLLFFIAGVGAIIAYGYSQRKEEGYRKFIGNVLLKLPIFGTLLRKIYLARFCQSASLLLSSKTPLVTTLELIEDMIGFYPLEEAMRETKQVILSGESLHTGLAKFSIFDKRLISMVKIAEEINQLDKAFERLTKQYQEEIEYRTKLLGTVIEPLIIVIIGLVVGVIMVAMYLPMFNLSNVIK